MERLRLVCLALVAALFVACGGDGDSASREAAGESPTAPRSLDAAPEPSPAPATRRQADDLQIKEFAVPRGSGPHDVAPAPDGKVWYTAQRTGELGILDPATGATRHVKLGPGSAPHGVIAGPDGAAWITDSGQNAIVRVDPVTDEVTLFRLPPDRPNANLNTAAFDANGVLWFTGQAGVYGRVDPRSGKVDVYTAPGGRGPYGITVTLRGEVFYASLAGSHIARIDPSTGAATQVRPPTPGQGARRVWTDSTGKVWVSEWNAGAVGMYDPASNTWKEWKLPGARPMAYAVFVDGDDVVWLSDFGSNAMVRFDPRTEQFTVLTLPSVNGNVRQIHGRDGEVWAAESGADKVILIETHE